MTLDNGSDDGDDDDGNGDGEGTAGVHGKDQNGFVDHEEEEAEDGDEEEEGEEEGGQTTYGRAERRSCPGKPPMNPS